MAVKQVLRALYRALSFVAVESITLLRHFFPQHAALSTQHYLWLGLLSATIMTACATIPTPTRIALLAPFEGRYREIGYDALYAARLALQDAATNQIELLPIDDGGTVDSAVDRARALAADPQIRSALVLGYPATDPQTLTAFGDVPVLVVGYWGTEPITDRVFVLANPDLANDYTIPARVDVLEAAQTAEPIVGGEVLALSQIGDLRSEFDDITIVTSMTLPDADFRERYLNSDQFAPEPGLFAPATYDAMMRAIYAVQWSAPGRFAAANHLGTTQAHTLQLEAGYLTNAPIFTYTYAANGDLIPMDRVVE